MFLKDEKTNEQVDHYNYDIVDYLFECVTSPYELWDLEISQREIKAEDYEKIGRNEPCPAVRSLSTALLGLQAQEQYK